MTGQWKLEVGIIEAVMKGELLYRIIIVALLAGVLATLIAILTRMP